METDTKVSFDYVNDDGDACDIPLDLSLWCTQRVLIELSIEEDLSKWRPDFSDGETEFDLRIEIKDFKMPPVSGPMTDI